MTVQDLINKLLDYPSNMRVLTLGYEGGYNDIELTTDEVVFNFSKNDAWYYGPHESVRFSDGDTGTQCLVITRGK